MPTGGVDDTVPKTLPDRPVITLESSRSAPRRNAASSPCCSVTWWVPRSFPDSLTPKTYAPWCAPTGGGCRSHRALRRPYRPIPRRWAAGLFCYPTAHEDDARRAVYTGLGIVEAIATLNSPGDPVRGYPRGAARHPHWPGRRGADGGWRAARASGARGNAQHRGTAARPRAGKRGSD